MAENKFPFCAVAATHVLAFEASRPYADFSMISDPLECRGCEAMIDCCKWLRQVFSRLMWTVCWLAASLLLSASIVNAASSTKKISYNRDIRPLLANSCYTCHGPERGKRKAGLRLDDRDSAVREAIVPGNSAESPLFQRVSTSDPDEQMPPKESKRPRLPPAAVAIIRQWIDEGARYEPHWAYVRPMRSQPPVAQNAAWANNSIDHFIAAVHEEQGLKPSPDADPRTLARRLRFDLTGLPPSPAEVDAFAADHSPAAYEKLVDRLLASPQFGERMAVYWLDVARYADSGGYHSDNERTVWLYRDYVVQAFNGNKPFDQFTKEQLAGDLLPGSTDEQKIASGYNRMLQTTEEGGRRPRNTRPSMPPIACGTWAWRGWPRPPAAPSATTTSSTPSRRRISTVLPRSSPTSARWPRAGKSRRPCPRPSRRPGCGNWMLRSRPSRRNCAPSPACRSGAIGRGPE